MSKSISAALQTDIQRAVTTLATCVKITRRDGKPLRLTSHEEDLTVNGEVYDHNVSFILGAIDSGSSLAIDNTELTLFADDVNFTREEFDAGLWDQAEVEIFEVDYENITDGKLTLRRGWFGRVVRNRQNEIKITITGLLKILDFEVGRVYQPTCDADLGDARCKIAIKQEQIRSPYNYYSVGDWVFNYDTALMNEITLVNGGFESDGARSEAQAITGWTKSEGCAVFVATDAISPTYGSIATLPAGDGTYSLYGSQDATPADSGAEQFIYQDVDLLASGISAGLIDDGQISLAFFGLLAHTVYLNDPVQLRIDLLDVDGEFVGSFSSRWQFLDEFESWRERAVVCPIYPGARTARLYFMFNKQEGLVYNAAVDRARLYWWNHTIQTPYDDVIHRCTRILDFGAGNAYRPPNASFEADGIVANANNPTIRGWTVSGWWRVDNDLGDVGQNLTTVPEGSYFLTGGDDGTTVQRTNTMTQTFNLSAVTGLNTSRVLLGKYVARFDTDVGFAGAGESTATVMFELKNSSNQVLDTIYLMNDQNYGGVNAWQTNTEYAVIPASTTKITITLIAKSPSGDGDAKVAFDKIKVFFYDSERPVRTDPSAAAPATDTVMQTGVGDLTLDDLLVWKAMPAYTLYDEVGSVTDRKTFTGTGISGVAGTYETGTIWWISGRNAGLRNVIRTWDPDTKQIKMYFRMPYDIAVGDRFVYVRGCQRRFTQDCLGVFENQINFRGFPVLPGRLRDATDAENDAG